MKPNRVLCILLMLVSLCVLDGIIIGSNDTVSVSQLAALPSLHLMNSLLSSRLAAAAAAYQMEFLSLFYGWRAEPGPESPSEPVPSVKAGAHQGPGDQEAARGPVCGSPQLSSSSPQLSDHPEQTNFLNTEHLPSLGNTLSEDAVTPGIQNVSWQETLNKLWDCRT